jgi:anti-sigma factor RsiW
MDKELLEGMLIEYIDGTLSPAERAKVEQELAKNEGAYRLYEQLREVIAAMDKSEKLEPGAGLKTSFEHALHDEIRNQKGKTVFFRPVIYRAAAAILLVVAGVAIGNWMTRNQQREEQIAALAKEVADTKQMMLLMIDNRQSASQRIQGANVALKIVKADDEVVRALTKTMNEDPNTNVRLAALEALARFHDEPLVRQALIESLARQKDPVVQIALIQLMVQMKEKNAVKELENIIEDTETINAVKDEAYTGLLKLS